MKLVAFILLSFVSTTAMAHDPGQAVEWIPFIGALIAMFLVGYFFRGSPKEKNTLKSKKEITE